MKSLKSSQVSQQSTVPRNSGTSSVGSSGGLWSESIYLGFGAELQLLLDSA
jgi:hypothetical protein